MKREIKRLLSGRFLPKWIILCFDLSVICVTFFLSYWLRIDLGNLINSLPHILLQAIFGLPLFFLAYYLLKPHHGIIRHTTSYDAIKIVCAHLFGSSGLLFLSVMAREASGFSYMAIPYSVIITHFFISVFILAGSRLCVKYIYYHLTSSSSHGEAGEDL